MINEQRFRCSVAYAKLGHQVERTRAICSGIIISLLMCSIVLDLNAQTQSTSGTYAFLTEGLERSTPTVVASNAEFLDSIFSPHSIPLAGIPVLKNALGDVVHDSVVNVLDLLRLRDITIGRPPAATQYELLEADITVDGQVDGADLIALRDILLYKKGIPHLVDSTGGEVAGGGVRLTIPPGAVDSTVVISVERRTETQFASEFGVDTRSAVDDSAFFMASFEITSSTPDFKLPVNATIKLDSVPPCAYQGLNGLFAAVPDRDGDGRSELFLINELQVNGDSLKLTTKDIQVPSIQSLSHSQIEPGKTLFILGKGFGNDIQNIIAEFRSMSTDSVQFIPPSGVDDSMIVLIAPGIASGQYQLIVHNVLTGLVSNSHLIEIQPPGSVVGDIRSIIVSFFMNLAIGMDSISTDSLVATIEDTTVRNYIADLRRTSRTDIDSAIVFYLNLDDSLIIELGELASFVQNMSGSRETQYYTTLEYPARSAQCPECMAYVKEGDLVNAAIAYWTKEYNFYAVKCARDKFFGICIFCEAAEKTRQRVLSLTDQKAMLVNLYNDCTCRNCPIEGEDCECPETVFIGFGPQSRRVTGGYGPGGFETKGCCINIIRYKRNQCISVPKHYGRSPVPIQQRPELKCPSNLPMAISGVTSSASTNDVRPSPGSIIKITNAQVPYNIVGILNDNGKAFIPHVPISTQITFSMYDPVTGLYDPNVGTYTTGSTPGGFDRPILLFQPSTQIRNFSIRIGESVHDSVSLDFQRIDYLLNIGDADTFKLLNIGFSASARLSLRIEDPEGSLLFDNTDVTCYSNAHLQFSKIGIYRIRVAFGVSGQSGSFDLGVNISPYPPLPFSCLCGNVLVDTLFSELSPYSVKCSINILASDTVTTEAGVTLQFEQGGAVTATGILVGIGSSTKPIKLKQSGTLIQEFARIKKPVSDRKEVQP